MNIYSIQDVKDKIDFDDDYADFINYGVVYIVANYDQSVEYNGYL